MCVLTHCDVTIGPKDGSTQPTIVNFFARLEFQDGKRKRYVDQAATTQQFYHGRGTPHVHLLVWLSNAESIHLEKEIQATSPADNEQLKCLVEGSQRSYTGSGWPQYPKASHWDPKQRRLRLYNCPIMNGYVLVSNLF